MLIALTRRTTTAIHLQQNLAKFPSFTFYFLYSSIPLICDPEIPNSLNPKPLTKPQLKTLVNSHFNHGRYTNLLQNVVASPSLLLTAAQNITRSTQLTLDSASTHLNLLQLGNQLAHNEFDVESCCVAINPPHKPRFRSGSGLVLPNLQLKVVIEALRLVLDVVFEGRYGTFCYGGRDGLGRHTAVRYLKKVVKNPSWWFSVGFDRKCGFDHRHVERLCRTIGERISDERLIGLIVRLFECNVVRIEFGKGELGKGLPQECGLCGVLVNIYLSGFDQKVEKIRRRMNEGNGGVDGVSGVVMYKPMKVYVVRYLDEILMITTGSKVLAGDLLNWVVKYLENELELNVDRLRSSVHSATVEKMEFLGMEFQAVPPSVLTPPLKEKAKRARKKYRRQKEVELLEMKNARERNRRVLGMKLFSHVFKKLKQSNNNECKFEYQIESEVREIFRTWADEVVRDFLGSLEGRMTWYRHLTAGDFLKLERIRDQLPNELIDAYDKFQEEVNKHLSPAQLHKAKEKLEREAEVEEEREYSERTVADLTKLSMKVTAPMVLVKKAVRLAGFTNNMGRPRPISWLTVLEDADIVKWYAGVGLRWLMYFACCHNIEMVNTVVNYHLRYSCLLTLAEKHDATKSQTIKHYTKELKVLDFEGNEQVYFPTLKVGNNFADAHLSDPRPVDAALTLSLIRLAHDEPSYTCAAHFCDRKDTITYRVWLLQHRLNQESQDQNKWVPGVSKIHDSLHRKCYPLCADHISDLYMGRISLQDIDCTSFVDVD